jgi:GT2 family glycosyltransferase
VAAAYPAVRVLSMDKNLGMAARNDGARAARSPAVLMLDDDSGPEPGTLELLLTALNDPSVGIAAALVRLPGGQYEEGGGRHVHIGCGAAFRRDVLLGLGGYHPEYECYVDEYDLAYRALAADLRVAYVPDALIWHEPNARSTYDYMVEKLTANNAYLAAKFYPWDEALRFIAWTTYRYSVFARKRGALTGFRRALEEMPDKILRGQTHRQTLPDRALDLVLPQRETARTFLALRSHRAREIAFLRAGKEIPGLIRAAQGAGLTVHAIYESPDGLLLDAGHLFGVPVRPVSEFKTRSAQTLFVGGTSPGFILNTLQAAADLGLPTPQVP